MIQNICRLYTSVGIIDNVQKSDILIAKEAVAGFVPVSLVEDRLPSFFVSSLPLADILAAKAMSKTVLAHADLSAGLSVLNSADCVGDLTSNLSRVFKPISIAFCWSILSPVLTSDREGISMTAMSGKLTRKS